MPYARPQLRTLRDVNAAGVAAGRVLVCNDAGDGFEFVDPQSGPQGEKGDKGDTGDAGPKGDKGDTGPNMVGSTTATDLAGLLKGNGSSISVAEPGTDYAAAAHTHVIADVSGLQAAIDAKADLVGGVVPTSQIPAIAISEFLGRADNESEMTALDGQRGDYCYRTDLQSACWLTTDDPTDADHWLQVALPTVSVQSVNGQTGTVVLNSTDVGAASSSDLASHVSDTSNPHEVTKGQVGLSNV